MFYQDYWKFLLKVRVYLKVIESILNTRYTTKELFQDEELILYKPHVLKHGNISLNGTMFNKKCCQQHRFRHKLCFSIIEYSRVMAGSLSLTKGHNQLSKVIRFHILAVSRAL
jgi:hypothetical protein